MPKWKPPSQRRETFNEMEFVYAARAKWDEFQKHPKISQVLAQKGQRGVVVCVFTAQGKGVVCERVGDLAKSEVPPLETLARAARMHLELNKKHVISYQNSRLNPDNVSAALRIAPRIFTCAGISEELGHLLLLRCAIQAKLITPHLAVKITGLFPKSRPQQIMWEDID